MLPTRARGSREPPAKLGRRNDEFPRYLQIHVSRIARIVELKPQLSGALSRCAVGQAAPKEPWRASEYDTLERAGSHGSHSPRIVRGKSRGAFVRKRSRPHPDPMSVAIFNFAVDPVAAHNRKPGFDILRVHELELKLEHYPPTVQLRASHAEGS